MASAEGAYTASIMLARKLQIYSKSQGSKNILDLADRPSKAYKEHQVVRTLFYKVMQQLCQDEEEQGVLIPSLLDPDDYNA